MQVVKKVDDPLVEETLKQLIGSYIKVPTNYIIITQGEGGGEEQVNAWFAGLLVGYEKHCLLAEDNSFLEFYKAVLGDGITYLLNKNCEIFTITEDEYAELYQERMGFNETE